MRKDRRTVILLILAVIMALFAVGCKKAELKEPVETPVFEALTPTIAPTPEPTPELTPEPTPEPTPTPYFGRFGEKFYSEEYDVEFATEGAVIQDETSYISETISFEVTTYHEEGLTYFFADIYIKDIESLKTAFSRDKFNAKNEKVLEMARRNGALVAINGDYYTAQEEGIIIRNGELFKSRKTSRDVCVLFRDGTMKTYGPKEWDEDEIMAADPWQSWVFGPNLVREGVLQTEFNTSVSRTNPRAAIGYFEPGHYCFVVVDGRQGSYSKGLDMQGLADLMYELGCKEAYNLDGGATAVMVLFDEQISRQSDNGRGCGDIIYIKEAQITVQE